MTDFRVGFGRVNITPDFPAPLDSYGTAEKRIHDRVLNELYFTAIAITDETGKTLMLTTYDLTQCRQDIRDEIAGRLEKELGVDPDYFHLSGTHTHSSVAIWVESEDVINYRKELIEKAVKACKTAMDDRKKAEIFVGENKTENLNFVRHYMRADGTITGDNYGQISRAPSVKHMTEVDNSMRVIKFKRTNEDGSEARDVVIVNWQAHNHLTGGSKKTDLAADFSGAMRSFLESEHNCFATFFQGCAGNVNEKSRITRENRTTNYLEHGRLLAGYVSEIYDDMKPMPSGRVVSKRDSIRLKTNHAGEDRLEDAKRVYEHRLEHGIDDDCKQLALDLGFHSAYHAISIVKRSLVTDEYIEAPLSVYRIGDIGWSAVPFEMFDETGKEIREASPFPFTVTQGYTDANFYYLPTKTAFGYGSYEVDSAKYEEGSAEKVRDKMIEMLNSIY